MQKILIYNLIISRVIDINQSTFPLNQKYTSFAKKPENLALHKQEYLQ